VYDSGEQTYTKTALYNFNQPDVNLVIPAAVGTIDRDSGVSITANSIRSEVDITATYGIVSLTATDGPVTTSNLIQSDNDVTIRGQTIDISNSNIRSNYGEITIAATQGSGGTLTATGAQLQTNPAINLESNGDIILTDAALRTESWGTMTADLGGPNTLHISGTSVQGATAIRYTPAGVTESPERAIAQPQ